MAAETSHDLNSNNWGPAGPYRELVPPGTSYQPMPQAPFGSPHRPEITAWQRVQIARHPDRPHTLDYIQRLCVDFVELHGDRLFGDDASIIGGLAGFEGQTVMVIGHQKGSSTKENITRNFGMAQPEGYRKAQRRIGQAIAANLMTMLTIEVPIITTVIGEGGSGGALAIGLGDRVLMLENSIYSVITPEGCASILWRDQSYAEQAALALKLTAPDL